ncbi:hypothetical protein Tco_0193618 [Tanacetum coccineum]
MLWSSLNIGLFTNLPDDFGRDLVPLDELVFDSYDLGPFDGSLSLLVFRLFNPWSNPTGGSSSLSLSSRPLFNQYAFPYDSKRILFYSNSVSDAAASSGEVKHFLW